VCGGFGIGRFWYVAFVVCGVFGMWKFWSCGGFGLVVGSSIDSIGEAIIGQFRVNKRNTWRPFSWLLPIG